MSEYLLNLWHFKNSDAKCQFLTYFGDLDTLCQVVSRVVKMKKKKLFKCTVLLISSILVLITKLTIGLLISNKKF